MKIAHVIATFPPHIGGMGEVALEEAELMQKRGHEVTVFTLCYPNFVYHDQNFSFKVVRLHPWFKMGDAGWTPALVFKLRGFDVVHLHYPFYGGTRSVYLASLFFKQKYVVTYHMDAAPRGALKQVLQKIYDWFWAKSVLQNAQKIFSVDKDHLLYSQYGRYLAGEKIVELANPVNTEIFSPQTSDYLALGLDAWKNKKIFLFVGNLLPIKKLDLLMAAIKNIPNPDVVLLVVGGGYEEEFYQTLAYAPNLKDRVKFVGSCADKKKLADYYNLAIAVVVPSSVESFSLVAIEAMSCGRPIIISNLPGLRSRLADANCGLLFTPNSVDDLQAKIVTLINLSSDEIKKIGEAGRAQVLKKYNLVDHINILEKVYLNL